MPNANAGNQNVKAPVDARLRQRVVGAVVLTLLAIIILPMLLDGTAEDRARVLADIPEAPVIEFEPLTVADFDREMKAAAQASEARLPRRVATDKPAPGEAVASLDSTAAAAAEAEPATPQPATPQPAAPQPATPPNELVLDDNLLPVSWSLQLGSFQNPDNATRLRGELRAAGHRSYVIKVEQDDGDTYRVYIGPVLKKSRLEAIQPEVEARFNLTGRIVRYQIEDDAGQLGG